MELKIINISIFLILSFLQNNLLSKDLEKVSAIIENKFSCKVDYLDGYSYKLNNNKSFRMIKLELSNSPIVNNSTIPGAIASDCAIIMFENLLKEERESYDTIIVFLIKENSTKYDFRYGIKELGKAKQNQIKVDQVVELILSKKTKSVYQHFNKEIIDENFKNSLTQFISQIPDDLKYLTYGYSIKQYQGKEFYVFLYILRSEGKKKTLSLSCSFNGTEQFLYGFETSNQY